jgi:hypothetical protein
MPKWSNLSIGAAFPGILISYSGRSKTVLDLQPIPWPINMTRVNSLKKIASSIKK